MPSSSLIQALLLWCCLQWRNARLYSVLFDVAPCYWKSLCKIPRAQNSWRYESIVLTNRNAGKRMNIKKIKLYQFKCVPEHDKNLQYHMCAQPREDLDQPFSLGPLWSSLEIQESMASSCRRRRLIRLRGHSSWSEFSLCAHVFW